MIGIITKIFYSIFLSLSSICNWGQVRINADSIQRLKAREFVMRRYLTEQERETDVIYVPRTKAIPGRATYDDLQVVKRNLIKERGVTVRDALNEINRRDLEHPNDSPAQA